MANWAEDMDDDLIFDDGEQDFERSDLGDDLEDDEEDDYSGDEVDVEQQWENAQVVREITTDEDGKRFEVTKKVRSYHVDREITAADIRARFAKFGKGKTGQSELVAPEPPAALELGLVDSYERESRAELKRFIFEVSGMEIKPSSPRFLELQKELRRKREEDAAKQESSTTGGDKQETWRDSRATRTARPAEEDPDVQRRVRVSNLSENITEENLYDIFGINGCVVENVFLPKDRVTGRVRGYAFITFADKRMAENALKNDKIRFKNVVLQVVKAIDKR